MDEIQQYINFENWAKNNKCSLVELFPTVHKNAIYNIDLSIGNTTVKSEVEFNNPTFFEEKLAEIQTKNPDKIIAGGYLEKRALYTSSIYNDANSSEKRNIHLGVDFWLPKNTKVNALLDGEIVCSIQQKSHKGYGGFIILKHTFNNLIFYTLYGHLSTESTKKYKKGYKIKKGNIIGKLGAYSENGEWVPHLHFQIMLSLLNYKNDFPGVVLEKEVPFWKTICPNPNLILNI